MRIKEREELLNLILESISKIPQPPPGREMALVKTKLQEAKLWLQEYENNKQ